VVQPNGGGTGRDRLEYVGQVGQGQGDLHIGLDRMGLGHVGLQIWWNRLVTVQLNQSTCRKVGLQGRAIFGLLPTPTPP